MSNFEPKYTLFDGVEEMLSRETLSSLLKRRISQVTYNPFDTSNGFSRNELYKLEVDEQKFVMKRLRPAVDWLAIISNDHLCRSIRVWQYGLLDRLQPYIQHGILAACQDGDDFAILMCDVSPGLLNGQELTPRSIYHILDMLARMHAIFWEEENLKAVELGLINNLASIIPFSTKPEHYQHAPHILEILQHGWSALYELVEPDIRDALQSLMENPLPLNIFLAKLPATFVHKDFRQDNLAFFPETMELIAFDWQMAGYAPLTMDLCWFMGSLAEQLDQHEAYYQYYQRRLSTYLGDRFDPNLWRSMLEVGCLVEVILKGSWHAFFAVTSEDESFRAIMRRSVNSYNDIVRKGLVWL